MKESFNTSVGRVEILVDEQSRTVSAYRFDAEGRPIAAAIESWDYTDLTDLLARQAGVPIWEARDIASAVSASVHMGDPPLPEAPQWRARRARERRSAAEYAGIPLRFVAVLLDGFIVFFPAGIIFGLLSGGGYTQTGNGYAKAGINIEGKAFLVFLFLWFTYYVVCEAGTGATLGKRIVGIQVICDDGEDLTLGAAVVRNLLRLIDGLFFYLVGTIFALTSAKGQRLGDRAAHTLVVRR
jgi:uncharacterized RDD family membrane protein YckC